MAVDEQTLIELIKTGLPDCTVRIEDMRGDGDHYAAYVESPSFAGKNRVQQHQMVYAALKGTIGESLHALVIQTSVPTS